MFYNVIFLCISLVISKAVMCNELNFPSVVDINSYKIGIPENNRDSNTAWKLGLCGFNCSPELISFFLILKNKYGIKTAIETGTSTGSSSVILSYIFEKVHTIEILNSSYELAKKDLSQFPNITCHLGSSEKVLNNILPFFESEPVLFYLDAHWQNYWPLLDELEEISKTHKDNCIIVIDDIKVPGRNDIRYDQYGIHECSYDYVQKKLDEVLSSYDIHYLIPKSLLSAAKFVAIPKQWNLKS